MIVLGIDPGATTAMVVRDGDRLLEVALETVDLTRDLEVAIELVATTAADLVRARDIDLVAVEAAVAPTAYNRGRLSMIDPAPIIATAHLVGALVVSCAAVLVPPGSHGSKIPPGTPAKAARAMLESLYPAELIGPRETTGTGKSPRQHLRAAWDVAGAARTYGMARPISGL